MRKADNLPPYCAVVKKSRSLNFLDPSGPAWPVTGVLYLYLYHIKTDPKDIDIALLGFVWLRIRNGGGILRTS